MKKSLILFSTLLLMQIGCKKQRSVEEDFQMEAQKITEKYCPRQIEKGIMLDSTVYDIRTHTLYYYYTMDDPFDDKEAINNGKAKFREALKEQIMTSIDLKKYKDRNITFQYIYHSKKDTNHILLKEIFTEKDYTLNNFIQEDNDTIATDSH